MSTEPVPPGDNPLPRRLRYSPRAFMRRGVFAAGVRFGGLFCVFGLQVLLARLVGDTGEYGKYAWGQSLLFVVGTLACLGLPVVTARFIASLDARHDIAGAQRVIRRAAGLLLRSVALPFVLGIALWQLWPPGAGQYRDVAIIALLLSPALSFTMFYRDVCRARQRLALALLPMQVMRPLVAAGLALTVYWLGAGQPMSGSGVLAIAGGSILLVLLLQMAVYYGRSALPAAGADIDDNAGAAPEYHPSKLMRTAMPVFFTRCADLVITYANILLLGFFAGPAAAGAYFAAERLAQMAFIPKNVVSLINQQSMAAAHATDNRRDLQRLATQSAHGSLWPTLAVSLALATLATPLLELFGRDFSNATPVLLVLVANAMIKVVTGPTQDLLVMTGHQSRIPLIMAVSAVCHVAALLLLVPAFGAVGAAVASIVSSLVSHLWLLVVTYRLTGIGPTVLHRTKSRTDG